MRLRRHHLLLTGAAFALVAMVAASGCSKSNKSSAADTSDAPTTTASPAPINQGAVVQVSEYQFSAATVTIKAGQSVEWHNVGNVQHTVTQTAGKDFSSPDIGSGQTYVQTFDKPGTYTYICSIHPDRMHGTVVVTAASN